MCILFVHTLLKVVSYYGLSVLSMSLKGFQKKHVWMGVGGWGELYQLYHCGWGELLFWILGMFFTLQSPLRGKIWIS